MKMNGAESLAFDTIVASGPNSSMPHAVPTDRKIEEKDIIQFDFGCKVNRILFRFLKSFICWWNYRRRRKNL